MVFWAPGGQALVGPVVCRASSCSAMSAAGARRQCVALLKHKEVDNTNCQGGCRLAHDSNDHTGH